MTRLSTVLLLLGLAALAVGACAGSNVYVGVAAPHPWYGPPVPYGGGVVIGRPIW